MERLGALEDPVLNIDIALFDGHYWNETIKKVKRAVVFLEDSVYRVLHLNGGVERLLLDGKAADVREFSSFIHGKENEKKGVFILSSALLGLAVEILKEVISESFFEYIQVITTAGPSVHAVEDGETSHTEGTEIFKDLECSILEWMGNPNFTCEIFQYPLNFVSLTEDLFCTPTFDQLFPILREEFESTLDDEESHEDSGFYRWTKLSDELRLTVRQFSSFWVSFFGMYDIRPDIFTVGKLSSIIGDRLELLISLKNKNAASSTHKNKATVIFLDRSLDLHTPTSVNFDCVLDRIFEDLPTFKKTKEDVAVDLSELYNSRKGSLGVPPGALLSSIKRDKELWRLLLSSDSVCISNLHRKLQEILRDNDHIKTEKITSNLAKRFVASVQEMSEDEEILCEEESKSLKVESQVVNNNLIRDMQNKKPQNSEACKLKTLLSKFNLQNEVIAQNLGLLVASFALKNVLEENDRREELNSLRTILFKTLSSEGSERVLESLIDIARNREISLEEFLSILIWVFSQMPPSTIRTDQEDELHCVLSDRILEDCDSSFLENVFKNFEINQLLVHRVVKSLFEKCSLLSSCTSPVLRKSGFKKTYLEHFIEDLYSDDRKEVPNMVYKSRGSLGGRLIKSGLSLFGLSVQNKKIHPRENPIIIIYVVGGILPSEFRKIKEAVRQKNSRAQFLVGSNRILNSKSISNMLLASGL